MDSSARILSDNASDVLAGPAGTILVVGGEIDASWVPQVERLIIQLVARGQPVVVDLAQVTFLDCCGLGGLLDVVMVSRQCDIVVTLGSTSETVDRPLDLVGCRGWLTGNRPSTARDASPPSGGPSAWPSIDEYPIDVPVPSAAGSASRTQ